MDDEKEDEYKDNRIEWKNDRENADDSKEEELE